MIDQYIKMCFSCFSEQRYQYIDYNDQYLIFTENLDILLDYNNYFSINIKNIKLIFSKIDYDTFIVDIYGSPRKNIYIKNYTDYILNINCIEKQDDEYVFDQFFYCDIGVIESIKQVDTKKAKDISPESIKQVDTKKSEDTSSKQVDTKKSEDISSKQVDTKKSEDISSKQVDTKKSEDTSSKHVDTKKSENISSKQVDTKKSEEPITQINKYLLQDNLDPLIKIILMKNIKNWSQIMRYNDCSRYVTKGNCATCNNNATIFDNGKCLDCTTIKF